MKAVVFDEFGPPEVLYLDEIEKPQPADNEVSIRVVAASVTKYDCWVRSCTAPPGFDLILRIASGKKPKQRILGTDVAGVVDALGQDVTQYKVGDQVMGYTGMKLNAHAEFVCLPVESVAPKPPQATFEEAACVLQGALTALFFLRKANIQPGQKVLIYGASGGVGGYAVQIARHHYQAEVTGVCSAAKADMVRSLGASHVMDYTKDDFTKHGKVYDVVFDTVGKTQVGRIRSALAEKGWYLLATFGLSMLLHLVWLSLTSHLNIAYGSLKETQADLLWVSEMIDSGVIHPVVDRCFPAEQASVAHRYIESGAKKGGVLIRFNEPLSI